MTQKKTHLSHEAIIFFSEGGISKEMLYTEFEALLDCVVPMRHFAGRNMEAAYVRLDENLAVAAVVLFIVPFDPDGFLDKDWNIPLRNLADAGSPGPDLGGGPMRLATHSQCPIPGNEDKLWDVQFGVGGNTLNQLQERLRQNRLGIDATDIVRSNAGPVSAQSWGSAPAAAGFASVAAAPTAESANAVLVAMQQSNQQLAMLKEQHQRELMAMQERLGTLHQQAKALQEERSTLTDQLHLQTQQLQEERKRAEAKLQQLLEKARAQVASMRREVETERDAALAERDTQMRQDREQQNELLHQEMEKHHRERQQQEDHLTNLRAEITDLRMDKRRLMGDGADKFFEDLKARGVKFVAYQPGAGHLTIPMDDMHRFIEETDTYVAEKCGVSVDQYRRWLVHYNNPICQGSAGHGGQCAKPVTKLLKPAEFVAGMHDRCEVHKQVPRSAAAPQKT